MIILELLFFQEDYTIYLKYFSKYFRIPKADIIGTDIRFDDNQNCLGAIDGVDCTRFNKILKLKERIPNFKEYTLSQSLAYSDCLSDLPLLKLVGNGFAVGTCSQEWAGKSG